MSKDIRLLLQALVGALLFIGWLSLVGNPHVVETVIGLVIALIGAWWSGRFIRPKRKK